MSAKTSTKALRDWLRQRIDQLSDEQVEALAALFAEQEEPPFTAEEIQKILEASRRWRAGDHEGALTQEEAERRYGLQGHLEPARLGEPGPIG